MTKTKDPRVQAKILSLKKAARDLADEDMDRFAMVLRRWLNAPKAPRKAPSA